MRQAFVQLSLHKRCWLVEGRGQCEEVLEGSTTQFLAVVQLMANAYQPKTITVVQGDKEIVMQFEERCLQVGSL